MYRTGGNRAKGHAVQGLSVDETPHRIRGRAQVRCDAFGIGVWGPAVLSVILCSASHVPAHALAREIMLYGYA